MIGLGLLTLASGHHTLSDRTDRVDKSVFRLGLDWLKYCLKKNQPFQVLFWFQPLRSVANVR